MTRSAEGKDKGNNPVKKGDFDKERGGAARGEETGEEAQVREELMHEIRGSMREMRDG